MINTDKLSFTLVYVGYVLWLAVISQLPSITEKCIKTFSLKLFNDIYETIFFCRDYRCFIDQNQKKHVNLKDVTWLKKNTLQNLKLGSPEFPFPTQASQEGTLNSWGLVCFL